MKFILTKLPFSLSIFSLAFSFLLNSLKAESNSAAKAPSVLIGEKTSLGINVTLSGFPDFEQDKTMLLAGFRDGRIVFRDPQTRKILVRNQSDFSDVEMEKVRKAIEPMQASVKSLGCQIERFSCGRGRSLWFNKGAGMKRPGDLGVNGIPPLTSNLRIRGLSTTYPFEVPVRVIILWRGATGAVSSVSETGFHHGDSQSGKAYSPRRCRDHFFMEDFDLTCQGTPCDLYSNPVYRCGIERYCNFRFDDFTVVVLSRVNNMVLYTNCNDESLISCIRQADRKGEISKERYVQDLLERNNDGRKKPLSEDEIKKLINEHGKALDGERKRARDYSMMYYLGQQRR